jgi:hypothetical protein
MMVVVGEAMFVSEVPLVRDVPQQLNRRGSIRHFVLGEVQWIGKYSFYLNFN